MTLIVLFTTLLVPEGPELECSEPKQKVSSALLKDTVASIWKDAAVAVSASDSKNIKTSSAIYMAPLDMRQVNEEWSPRPRFRRWPLEVDVSFADGQVTFTWSDQVPCVDPEEAVRQRFAANLEKQGYRRLTITEAAEYQKAVGPQRGLPPTVQKRDSNDTELLVSYSASNTVGSSTYRSQLSFTWQVRRVYQESHPKLGELLAVLPEWVKVKFLDDKFFNLLRDEQIVRLNSGRGFSVTFAHPVRDKLISALEQTGFENQEERSPHSDGRIQKTWYRFSDVTYAHVITQADGSGLNLFCQDPQRTGAPLTVKPPPRHPSLKLPIEKRPIFTLDQLQFGNSEIQRQTGLFHNLAGTLAQKNWQVQLYKDHRNAVMTRYQAYWATSLVSSTSFLKKDRPYHNITISLAGDEFARTEPLDVLEVDARTVPLAGWAGWVSYRLRRTGDRVVPVLSATAGRADKNDIFSLHNSTLLTQQGVGVGVDETKTFHYYFKSYAPPLTFEQSTCLLYGTPEMLRDGVLEHIAACRLHAKEELDAGTTLIARDSTNARTDNPPREVDVSKRPPSAKTKQALWDAVDSQLTIREANIRRDYREIHAAIQQTLPLHDLLKDLAVQTTTAPLK